MTREEAIKVASETYGWLKTDREREALETLIPELAESEDERIIKTLQEYVNNRNWPLNGPTQEEVLAWLEKQKKREEGDRTDEAKIYWRGWNDSMKQKEQKSIESVAAEVTKDKESTIKFLKSAGIMDDNGELAEMYRSEQKPADLPAGFYVTLDGEKYYAKEMRCNGMNVKVVEPKPAEWSEEDEKILHAIELHVGQLDSGETINGFSSSDMLRVLKSLRPSWKPS
jgi:hypothetical protein